ncbi:hypothetical protein F5888DRAFT_1906686 [Russula emetica]|nr:hypothetical protein F5888DRAFT_1850857 [Russula emetica]KAF8497940.1 hypothetical protein F5888DRAFT_1906686 [Russula emetica]
MGPNFLRLSSEDNFKELGPIPRICIDFVEDPSLLLDYENHCQAMLTRATPHSLRHFVLKGGALDLDAELHTIFIVRHNKVDDLERAHLSANAELQLMTIINKLQQLEQIDLYHALASVNATKAVAGLAYESLNWGTCGFRKLSR